MNLDSYEKIRAKYELVPPAPPAKDASGAAAPTKGTP